MSSKSYLKFSKQIICVFLKFSKVIIGAKSKFSKEIIGEFLKFSRVITKKSGRPAMGRPLRG